jgi:hypothetical protein
MERHADEALGLLPHHTAKAAQRPSYGASRSPPNRARSAL